MKFTKPQSAVMLWFKKHRARAREQKPLATPEELRALRITPFTVTEVAGYDQYRDATSTMRGLMTKGVCEDAGFSGWRLSKMGAELADSFPAQGGDIA